MFEVESGIDEPPAQRRKREKTWHKKYPFERMEIGDSFLMPAEKDLSNSNLQSRVLAAAKVWNVKIRTMSVDGGVRVWRKG